MKRLDNNRGYALLAMLWLSLGVSGLLLSIVTESRDATGAARNRVALAQAIWLTEGCSSRVNYWMATVLREPAATGSESATRAWNLMDRSIRDRVGLEGLPCQLTIQAVGSRLDVNAADQGSLVRLFTAAGQTESAADSLAAAILDWKDADAEARATGAERPWYDQHNMRPPLNRAFLRRLELGWVRRLLDSKLDSLLDIEPGPLSLNHAPPALLATLPGFSNEVISVVRRAAAAGRPIGSMVELNQSLESAASNGITANGNSLAEQLAFDVPAWLITFRTRVGHPAVTMVLEVRFARVGAQTGPTRRKSWIE